VRVELYEPWDWQETVEVIEHELPDLDEALAWVGRECDIDPLAFHVPGEGLS
jgi:hypothetical protein